MSEVGALLKKNKFTLLILLVLFVSAGFLRLYNLGYSNYTADEYGAMYWTKETESNFPEDPIDFLLTRKKGPLQYLVSLAPVLITGEFNNELALRLPFAASSVLAVLAFYLLIARLTKSKFVGFVAAGLLMTSGFVAAFGRIAQYQNLNMLFSFLALFCYSELLVSKKNLLKKTLFGTAALSLSVLAHWDAIYVTIPAALILIQYFRQSEDSKKLKTRLVLLNIGFGALLTLPFLLPYFASSAGGGDGISYLTKRAGFNLGSNISDYIFDIEFYNPFLALWLYAIGGLIGALFIRKSWFFVTWFAANFFFFELFIKKPGTHIYNFLIPVFVLVALALNELLRRSFRYLRVGPILLTAAILGFLYYQTYLIFVDHSVEYPWRQEKVLDYKTPGRSHKNRTRYLIGFPHSRYWEEINEYINAQNRLNNEDFSYVTNESKTISEYYMEVPYKDSGGFYAVGIKRPWSFANDYKFPQIRGKSTVHLIQNEFGENVVRIYRVPPRE